MAEDIRRGTLPCVRHGPVAPEHCPYHGDRLHYCSFRAEAKINTTRLRYSSMRQKPNRKRPRIQEMKSEITIVGAGPYGLSLAAHLRKIPVLDCRIFGEPMSFWRDFMPKGMYLRSAWRACYIADPHDEFTLEAYQTATGEKFSSPVPLEKFVSYGGWFQEQA